MPAGGRSAAACSSLAARLDELNQERTSIEARMQAEALAARAQLRRPDPRPLQRSGVCLFDESWHQGVVGLVASRVKDRLRRPVIAFALAAEEHAARLGALGRRASTFATCSTRSRRAIRSSSAASAVTRWPRA